MNLLPWMNNEEVARTSLNFLQKKIDVDDFVYPVSSLPYSKSKIRRAILKFAPKFIKSSSDPKKEQHSIVMCYMSLANFMADDEAKTILTTRKNHSFEKTEQEKYLQLLSKKDDEERDLLDEIEQVYIDHGFREDLNALAEKFVSNPEDFLLFRGEGNTNKNGFRFTTKKEWAGNFGDTILEGRLPPNSKIHILQNSETQYAPHAGFTLENSWFLQFIEQNNYDAILTTDPMSPRTLEVIINPKHLRDFRISEKFSK